MPPSPSPEMALLEQRVSLLEARASVTPAVLSPPVTIGSLTNVPAAGSQLSASWAQDASSLVVHRFANATLLTAYAAANGSLAIATDSCIVYERVGGAWVQLGTNPTGTIRATIAAAADTGWLMLNGVAYNPGNTLYPALWAIAPSSWRSGTTLTLPDATGRTLLGGVLGQLGGANSRIITAANMPSHAHGILADGAHRHTPESWPEFAVQSNPGGGAGGFQITSGNRQPTSVNFTSTAPDHSHGGATQAAGSGAALDTTPAYLAVNWQIKT